MKRVLSWLRQALVTLYIEPLKEAFIDTTGLLLG